MPKGEEGPSQPQEQQDDQSEKKKKKKLKPDIVIKRLKDTRNLLEELLAASNLPSQQDRQETSSAPYAVNNGDDDDDVEPEPELDEANGVDESKAKELNISGLAVHKARQRNSAKASTRQDNVNYFNKSEDQLDPKLQPDSNLNDEETEQEQLVGESDLQEIPEADQVDESKTNKHNKTVDDDDALKISSQSISEGKKLAAQKPVSGKAGRRHTPTSSARQVNINDFKKSVQLADRKLDFNQTAEAESIIESDRELTEDNPDESKDYTAIEGVVKETEQEKEAGESDFQEENPDESKTDEHDDALKILMQSTREGKKLAVKKPLGGKGGRRHTPASSARHIDDFKKIAVLADRKLQPESTQQYFDQTTEVEGDRELTEDNPDETKDYTAIEGVVKETEQEKEPGESDLQEDNPDESKTDEHDDALKILRQSTREGEKLPMKKPLGGKAGRRHTPASSARHINDFKKIAVLADRKSQPDSAQQYFDQTTEMEGDRELTEDNPDETKDYTAIEGVVKETEQEKEAGESDLQEDNPDESKTDENDDALKILRQSTREGEKLSVKKQLGGKAGRRHTPASSARQTNINDFKKSAELADQKLDFDQTTEADPIMESDRELTEDNPDESKDYTAIEGVVTETEQEKEAGESDLQEDKPDGSKTDEHDDALKILRQSTREGEKLAGKKPLGGKAGRRQTPASSARHINDFKKIAVLADRKLQPDSSQQYFDQRTKVEGDRELTEDNPDESKDDTAVDEMSRQSISEGNYFNKTDEKVDQKLQPDSAQEDIGRERVSDEGVVEEEQKADESNLKDESQGTRSEEEGNDETKNEESVPDGNGNEDDEGWLQVQELGDLDLMGMVEKLGMSWFNKWSNEVEKLVEKNTELVYALKKKNNERQNSRAGMRNKSAHEERSNLAGHKVIPERERRVGTSEKAGKHDLNRPAKTQFEQGKAMSSALNVVMGIDEQEMGIDEEYNNIPGQVMEEKIPRNYESVVKGNDGRKTKGKMKMAADDKDISHFTNPQVAGEDESRSSVNYEESGEVEEMNDEEYSEQVKRSAEAKNIKRGVCEEEEDDLRSMEEKIIIPKRGNDPSRSTKGKKPTPSGALLKMAVDDPFTNPDEDILRQPSTQVKERNKAGRTIDEKLLSDPAQLDFEAADDEQDTTNNGNSSV